MEIDVGPPFETPVLVARNVDKRFGGVHALRAAGMQVGPTEVHGLVGENGSGKSTLLNILSGQLRADAGELQLAGEPARFSDPAAALAAGIATVTQETTLVGDLSVAENIFAGHRMVRRRGRIDWAATRSSAQEVLSRLELDLGPRRLVRTLRPDEQQMVEIARALSFRTRVLILDEPTSSLTDDEVQALFRVVRRLKENGVSTIFVSHRMEEIFAVCDRVTVLRDGRTVGSGAIGEYDSDRLIQEMVGRATQEFVASARAAANGETLLRVRSFSVPGSVCNVDIDVAAGEIVGLAGLVGAGRSELLEALFGLRESSGGEILLAGELLEPRSARHSVKRRLGYVPPDRKLQGLVLDMSVRENLMMATSCRRLRLRRPRGARELPAVRAALKDFDIRTPSVRAPVMTLSGGNQQKVLLGKWLRTDPLVLLMDEPTRGVDVGAKSEIYRLMSEAKEAGLGILLSSSETPELLRLCDRIAVMFRGRVLASLSRQEATEERIARLATGNVDLRSDRIHEH